MHSVLICDDNKDWLKILSRKLEQTDNLFIAAAVENGREALEKIKSLRPDIIILDIVIPEMDGINVIKTIQQELPDYRPIIYMISGMGTDTIVQSVSSLSVDFFSLKPVSCDTIVCNLKTLISQKKETITDTGTTAVAHAENMLDFVIRDITLQLGLKPYHVFSKCVMEVFKTYLYYKSDNPTLSKVVYPEAGKILGIGALSVEKNIRVAIQQMQKSSTALYQQIFSYTNGERITNREFLDAIADYIFLHNPQLSQECTGAQRVTTMVTL